MKTHQEARAQITDENVKAFTTPRKMTDLFAAVSLSNGQQ